MDKKTLKECSLKLEEMKSNNKKSLENVMSSLIEMEEIKNTGDDVDQSSNLSEVTRLKNLQKMLELKQLQISSAEKRLNSGKFGICVTCEDDIPKKRLLANPLSLRCLSCQEDQEQIDKENKMRANKSGAPSEEYSDEE